MHNDKHWWECYDLINLILCLILLCFGPKITICESGIKDCIKTVCTFNREKGQKVCAFLIKINECLKDSHLWATSYRADISPPGWIGKFFTKPISCPPLIVRETGQGQCSVGLTKYSTSKCFSPTDGLPVKRIYHRELNHSKKEPHNCEVCGQEVAKFLIEDLHVGDRGKVFLSSCFSTEAEYHINGMYTRVLPYFCLFL